MGARFELLDGDAEMLPGLSVVATPGHTVGHQCVLVQTGDGSPDLLIGDAAYTPREYTGRARPKLPPGQAADRPSWEASIGRVRSMTPSRVHFCHHTDKFTADTIGVTPDTKVHRPCASSPKPGSTRPRLRSTAHAQRLGRAPQQRPPQPGHDSIPVGGLDDQSPHTEDEIYVVGRVARRW